MMKKKILVGAIIATMLASCVACGGIHDNKGNTFKKDVTEKVTISDTEVAKDVMPTWFDNALAASIKASGELLGIPLKNYIIVSMNESYTC